jgi:hypothetical protein
MADETNNKGRPAKAGDRLIAARFGFIDGGFTTPDDPHDVVRILNGSVLEFEAAVQFHGYKPDERQRKKIARVGLLPVEWPELYLQLVFDSSPSITFHRLNPGQRARVMWVPDPHDAAMEVLKLICGG